MSEDDLTLYRLADLDEDALARLYAPPRLPWLRVNFVATLDGAAQGADGLSKSINNPVDKRIFDALRRRADCLVVGAGTLRAEGYRVPRIPLVVVSRSGQVPDSLREAPRGRIVMATVASAPALGEAREVLGGDNVLVLGESDIDLAALRAALAERGWREVLCEGGPQLFGSMVAAGVVDELCLTVVPRLVGGGHLRVMSGTATDVAAHPSLLVEQDGTLAGRWLVERS